MTVVGNQNLGILMIDRILCFLSLHDWTYKDLPYGREQRSCKHCPREEFRGTYFSISDGDDKTWRFFKTRNNGTIKQKIIGK